MRKDLDLEYKTRQNNQNSLKKQIHSYQFNHKRISKILFANEKKDSEIFEKVEEDDEFIEIDTSYKNILHAPLFINSKVQDPANPIKKPFGISDFDWSEFHFGGIRVNENFEKLAILDYQNNIHVVKFNQLTMQLKKEFNFNKKDFKKPWEIRHFDFFDKGNLLIGYDELSNNFCSFDLKKKKRVNFKCNKLLENIYYKYRINYKLKITNQKYLI